jgi:hypothetical protein
MFFSYLLLLIWPLGEDHLLDPDEIFVDDVISFASMDGKVMFIGVRRAIAGINSETYLFDFSSNQAEQLIDTRINLSAKSKVLVYNQDFVIVDRSRKTLIFLDNKGIFQEKKSLDEYRDFLTRFQLSYITQIDNDSLAVTFLDPMEDERIYLGRLHLKGKSFDVITDRVIEDDLAHGFYYPHNQRWYFVSPEQGSLEILNENYKRVSILVPEKEPHLVIRDRKIAALLRERGTSPFARLLDGPIGIFDGIMVFRQFTYLDGEKRPEITLVFANEKARVQRRLLLPLGSGGTHQLVFDKDEGAFILEQRAD